MKVPEKFRLLQTIFSFYLFPPIVSAINSLSQELLILTLHPVFFRAMPSV